MIEVVPASPAHIGTIATRCRDIDRLECAVFGREPKRALRLMLMGAAMAWTVKIDGRAEAMMGCGAVSSLEGIGQPWLIMTPVAARHARALLVLGRSYSVLMSERFPILENYVHADNEIAIRWLSRLGYTIDSISVINGERMRGFRKCADPQR